MKLERQIEQLELQTDELEAAPEEETVASPTPAPARARDSRRPVQRAPPVHLPREVRTILPKEAACPGCKGPELYSSQMLSTI